MSGEVIVFAILAIVLIVSAIAVVAFDNPVRSALALVVNFFVLAFLYFTLNAQLLGIVQILVYAGAIMVLFLFTIMLLNLGAGGRGQAKARDYKPALAVALGTGFFMVVLAQVILPLQPIVDVRSPIDYGTPQAIGRWLFTTYAWAFEMASVLLLIGIVGAILLAKRKL